MPKIIEKTVYTINELSDKAREQALQLLTSGEDIDLSSTIDDWTTILECLGFDNPVISYSGFWSQGDGASFTCDCWVYRKGMLDKIRKNYPTFTALHRYAKDLQTYAKKTGYKLEFSVYRHNNHYVHDSSVSCSFDYRLNIADNIQSNAQDVVQYLGREIYSQLQKEYEWLTSEDCALEQCEANDYLFDVDGYWVN